MSLREFEYIDEAVELLNDITPTLNMLSEELVKYFECILNINEQEYLNVNSRVKSEYSLREKIIRNKYLNKYKTPKLLIHNLSDLIGVRLECRFIEEERNIYKLLKSYFNISEDHIYYYNEENENIRIRLDKDQPRKQKNGFEIYRIDGLFLYGDNKINFEIQIKSMVNIFWSEIEHNVIYKNNAYVMMDKFLSDVFASIKTNLTLIDNQLLSVYKNFSGNNKDKDSKRKSMEKFLAKIAYDTFAEKMEADIGFIIDFKKPCETIINYSFNKEKDGMDISEDTTIKGLKRINEISKKDIDFNSKIRFGKLPEFEDEFCERLGNFIISKLNCEFIWNLFFRILFEVEPLNNKKDFENFILFIKEKVVPIKYQAKLELAFESDSKHVLKDIYMEVVDTLIEIDSIEILYEENLDSINNITKKVINDICRNVDSFKEYKYKRGKYREVLNKKIKDAIRD
ncbi:RelA/SpoT family protein [[Clostridium] bifermentans ATCC 638]|uniref:RelA/SpoT family protein n=1 Tax=Paraclostridium bifermentans ATCC 638 = DSM 14991 TaxID=1233171 RepID=T4VRQ4_PARBF|nr:RelA/SpoT family protein [Paraclostridium bifermentans]EQK43372.1 RelA/SpoT family protein [[Clostridium] bifermentans ATCC 638] [Paraclostridium bifermentans ATCC 638 = DSM 14991]RIZ60588.1 GTP pyrophosphokinase [Paraclostridium bifermentans]UAG17230.1 GTP pyrophosphokinase [Paraclostridium bifermentans]